jgi:hypothetical protein
LLQAGGQQEAFAGLVSIVAVAFVTWMIFWMCRTARHLKAELHGRLDAALALGGVALVLTAFLAVGREGLETALFLRSAVQATGQSSAPLVGIVAGLGVAVVLGYLLYRRAVALNLAKFFTYTCLHVGGQRGRAEGRHHGDGLQLRGGHHVAAGGPHYLRRHQQGLERHRGLRLGGRGRGQGRAGDNRSRYDARPRGQAGRRQLMTSPANPR